MKTLSLLAVLAALIYFHDGSLKSAPKGTNAAAPSASNHVVATEIVVAPAPSYQDRWKIACTDLKTGPNAQVTFAPFLPDSQANWNQNQSPGYTSISGFWYRR
jgi:hypothetical protein